MSASRTLRINIVGNARQLREELDGVAGRLDRMGGNLLRAGRGMTRFVTGPIVAGAAALGGLAVNAMNVGDELDKTSTKIGVSTDRLQNLRYWADQNGVSHDAMEKAVGRVTQRVGLAADGNEKYADAFSDLGVEIHDANGNLRDTDAILPDVVDAIMAGETPAERMARATELLGVRVARDLQPALEDGSLTLDEAAEAMDGHGRMTEEQIAKAVEASDAWDDFKQSITGIVQEVGARLLPILTDRLLPLLETHVLPVFRAIGERVAGVAQRFADLSPRTQAFIGAAIGLAAALGPVLVVVGKVLSAVAAMMPVIKAVGIALGALASPIGLVVAGVAALAAGLVYAWNNSETFREVVTAVWEWVRDAVVTAWEDHIRPALQALARYLVETAMPRFLAMRDVAETVWDAISTAVRAAWENVVQPVWRAIDAFIENVLAPAFRFMRSVAETVWGAISSAVEFAWNRVIEPLWSAMRTFIDRVLAPIFRTMRSVAETVWGAISTAVRAAWENVVQPVWRAIDAFIENVLAPAFRFFRRVGEAVFKDVRDAVRTAWEDHIRPIWNTIDGFIDNTLAPAFRTIRDVAKTAWETISGAIESAWETAEPVLRSLYDFVKDSLTPIWDGLKKAAETAWSGVTTAIGGALRTLGRMVSSFLDVGASIAGFVGMGRLEGVLSSGASTARGWGQGFNRGGWVPGSGPDRDAVPAMLTPGEFVLSRRAAARIPDAILHRLNDPSYRLARGIGGDGGDLGDAAQALNAGGYAKSPDEVLDWARRNSGPYKWAGFGPRFDCSGFMAALSNYAATGNHRSGGRWATGMATGSNRVGRFHPGKGDPETGFSIGIRPTSGSRVGHTAGTIAGTNVESSGGRGAHVGGARGYTYGPHRYHLPDYGGPSREMLGWFETIRDALRDLASPLGNDAANMLREAGRAPLVGARDALLDAVPFGGMIRDLVGLRTGGTVSTPGVVEVGEDGPEIVSLPTRATVSPRDPLTDLLAEQNAILRDVVGYLREDALDDRPDRSLRYLRRIADGVEEDDRTDPRTLEHLYG